MELIGCGVQAKLKDRLKKLLEVGTMDEQDLRVELCCARLLKNNINKLTLSAVEDLFIFFNVKVTKAFLNGGKNS